MYLLQAKAMANGLIFDDFKTLLIVISVKNRIRFDYGKYGVYIYTKQAQILDEHRWFLAGSIQNANISW